MLEPGCRFYIGAFGSRRSEVFTLIYFKSKLYKFYTLKGMRKDNAVINSITVQQKQDYDVST